MEPATEGEALSVAESRWVTGMARRGVDITGELRRDVERELLISPCTGADCRRMAENVGIDVDIRLARAGFTPEGSTSPLLTFCGVTVVVLLTSLISDALEIVLDLGMLVVPANEERRETREGVSDCAEDRLEDIVGIGQTAVLGVSCLGMIQGKGTSGEVVVDDNSDRVNPKRSECNEQSRFVYDARRGDRGEPSRGDLQRDILQKRVECTLVECGVTTRLTVISTSHVPVQLTPLLYIT